jgi:putative glutamine amidotransferase
MERRDALDQHITRWLVTAGFLPLPIPNTLPTDSLDENVVTLTAWLNLLRPNGILLSGGNDIGESLVRDETERTVLAWSERHRIPVLGICRGMQMMAVHAGSNLKPISAHVNCRHVIHGEISGEVNSYHNFAISCCPIGYRILAVASGGEIEAMRHVDLPWEGWMWHPERDNPFNRRDLDRLAFIIRGET